MPLIMPLLAFGKRPGALIKRGPPQNGNIVRYTMSVVSNSLNFHYSRTHARPPNATDDAYKAADGSLDLRIYQTCQVRITLDSAPPLGPLWCFPQDDDVITLGDTTHHDDPTTRYTNLDFLDVIDAGHCMTLAFDVTHREIPGPNPQPGVGHWEKNVDKFNIMIHLTQLRADMQTEDTNKLGLLIDPGIQNPGDDPP